MSGTIRTPRPAADDVDRVRQRIRGYILRMVRDAAEADDLTQETFLRAHRSLAPRRDGEARLHRPRPRLAGEGEVHPVEAVAPGASS